MQKQVTAFMSTSCDSENRPQRMWMVEGDGLDTAIAVAVFTVSRIFTTVPLWFNEAVIALGDVEKIVQYTNNLIVIAEYKITLFTPQKQLTESESVIYGQIDEKTLEGEPCAYSSRMEYQTLTLAQPEDPWAEEPGYPREVWRFEVSNEETSLGYWDWVETQRAQAEADLG